MCTTGPPPERAWVVRREIARAEGGAGDPRAGHVCGRVGLQGRPETGRVDVQEGRRGRHRSGDPLEGMTGRPRAPTARPSGTGGRAPGSCRCRQSRRSSRGGRHRRRPDLDDRRPRRRTSTSEDTRTPQRHRIGRQALPSASSVRRAVASPSRRTPNYSRDLRRRTFTPSRSVSSSVSWKELEE